MNTVRFRVIEAKRTMLSVVKSSRSTTARLAFCADEFADKPTCTLK